jgi:hypothetical protein
MHYWNKDYFEGLQRLGAAVAVLWPEYAEFARLQNQGLRTSAFATLSKFIERLRHEQLASRWQFVQTIYTQRHVDPRRVVPHPLRTEVMLPTLREVLAGSAPPPDAFLWMAHYFPDELARTSPADPDPKATFLRNAITRFASDDRIRQELAAHLLDQVEFDQHHLDESKYIGDAHADQEKLMEARRIIRDPSSSALLPPLDRAQALLDGWLRFLESHERDFPAWCKRNGIDPPDRVTRVYYE